MDWEKRYECHDTSQQVGQIKKENDQHENDQHGNNYEKDRPPPPPRLSSSLIFDDSAYSLKMKYAT